MELTATLVQVLPLQKGTGRNGEWKKQDIIVQTDGQYPKKVCVSIWGEKINDSILQTGNRLLISFDVESREYNGRWYTDVKAWKVVKAGAENQGAEYTDTLPPPDSFADTPSGEDDLPF